MQEDRDRLRTHLQEGEALLWAEAPDPRAFALNARRVLLLLGVLGLFGLGIHHQSPADFDYQHLWPVSNHNAVVWFLIVFAGIGLASMARPPQLTYGITNRRALVLEGRYLWSYPPEAIDGVSPQPRSDGLTDLMFTRPHPTADGPGVHISVQAKSSALMHAESQHDTESATSDRTMKRGSSRGGFRGLRDPTEAQAQLEKLRENAQSK